MYSEIGCRKLKRFDVVRCRFTGRIGSVYLANFPSPGYCWVHFYTTDHECLHESTVHFLFHDERWGAGATCWLRERWRALQRGFPSKRLAYAIREMGKACAEGSLFFAKWSKATGDSAKALEGMEAAMKDVKSRRSTKDRVLDWLGIDCYNIGRERAGDRLSGACYSLVIVGAPLFGIARTDYAPLVALDFIMLAIGGAFFAYFVRELLSIRKLSLEVPVSRRG